MFASVFVSVFVPVSMSVSLFLASLRFCVHYCIDRDTVRKKKSRFARFVCRDVHNKLENDLEANNKQTNVLD